MLNSSDLDATSPAKPTDYLAATSLIWRRVRRGVIVRRWDRNEESLALNPSAWLVLETLMLSLRPMVAAEVADEIAIIAGGDPAAFGDLTLILDDLVTHGLAIGTA